MTTAPTPATTGTGRVDPAVLSTLDRLSREFRAVDDAVAERRHWEATNHHAEDCTGDKCSYCGCCEHGHEAKRGCKVSDAPTGMDCPDFYCGCEGRA